MIAYIPSYVNPYQDGGSQRSWPGHHLPGDATLYLILSLMCSRVLITLHISRVIKKFPHLLHLRDFLGVVFLKSYKVAEIHNSEQTSWIWCVTNFWFDFDSFLPILLYFRAFQRWSKRLFIINIPDRFR